MTAANRSCARRAQPTSKPHWYEITIQSCPVCGGGKEYRERRFTPKPSDRAERTHFEEIYDWCNER